VFGNEGDVLPDDGFWAGGDGTAHRRNPLKPDMNIDAVQ
jgi:hypothetical protein